MKGTATKANLIYSLVLVEHEDGAHPVDGPGHRKAAGVDAQPSHDGGGGKGDHAGLEELDTGDSSNTHSRSRTLGDGWLARGRASAGSAFMGGREGR